MAALLRLVATLRRVGERVVAPLRQDETPENFRLSIPEAHTTTYDGSVGWSNRPPAVLDCPRCGSEILQHEAWDDIDCPRCAAEFDYREFTDLDLDYLLCPVCRSHMNHGQRHPERLDVPEWATCDECRYHWEFRHSFSRR